MLGTYESRTKNKKTKNDITFKESPDLIKLKRKSNMYWRYWKRKHGQSHYESVQARLQEACKMFNIDTTRPTPEAIKEHEKKARLKLWEEEQKQPRWQDRHPKSWHFLKDIFRSEEETYVNQPLEDYEMLIKLLKPLAEAKANTPLLWGNWVVRFERDAYLAAGQGHILWKFWKLKRYMPDSRYIAGAIKRHKRFLNTGWSNCSSWVPRHIPTYTENYRIPLVSYLRKKSVKFAGNKHLTKTPKPNKLPNFWAYKLNLWRDRSFMLGRYWKKKIHLKNRRHYTEQPKFYDNYPALFTFGLLKTVKHRAFGSGGGLNTPFSVIIRRSSRLLLVLQLGRWGFFFSGTDPSPKPTRSYLGNTRTFVNSRWNIVKFFTFQHKEFKFLYSIAEIFTILNPVEATASKFYQVYMNRLGASAVDRYNDMRLRDLYKRDLVPEHIAAILTPRLRKQLDKEWEIECETWARLDAAHAAHIEKLKQELIDKAAAKGVEVDFSKY